MRARARFIEAGLDDPGGIGERAKIGPLYQAPAVGRATEGITATVASDRTSGANLSDKRRHHTRAKAQERRKLSVTLHVSEPEGVSHVVGKIEVAFEVSLDVACNLRLEGGSVDAGGLRATETVRAKARPLRIEPAVLVASTRIVMEAMAVRKEARCFERHDRGRVVVGHILAERDGVFAHFRRRRARL